MSNSLSIIILAAGKGTRMNSATPKVLHKIANREIIMHIVDTCTKMKPENIYIVLGKNSDEIKKLLPKQVKIIIQNQQFGTAHALLCAKKKLEKVKGNLLVLYGDVPFLELKTLKQLIKKNDNINMLGFETLSPKGYGRIKFKKTKVLQVIEDKNLKDEDKKIKICYSGIFSGNNKKIFDLLSKVKKNKNKKEFLLTDIFGIANSQNLQISLFLAPEKEVMGINNLYQLSKAEEYFQSKLRKKFLLKGVYLLDPKSTYFSYDTNISSNVKIGSNNYFGKEVIIKNGVSIEANNNIENTIINQGAIIGPFSRLRNGTVIGARSKIGNFVEIKNSKIGANTKINHLSYIGDANVGSDTNIGAGTITCNYDGKQKHKTTIGNKVFIGSNCALIAPIKIGNESFVAAGSTISYNLKNRDFSIARAKQKIIKEGSKKFLK
ncbi:MAG: Bifunctional protein GlmU [Alphaproteobacteria bacterium MarineAlpha9_Bin4]|nr:bifunctional N-acetylglucosamine-1-phosphate uridyltransferase/glucosamine-1-phosphate acetyltransferase [Pelagibacterales bacterium]PPR26321.1 MAG: Bifunctional protein GlmU [Alphaproteobacteria bacterium MarineAlpha9_Bin4]